MGAVIGTEEFKRMWVVERQRSECTHMHSLSTLDTMVVKIFIRAPPITLIELSDQRRSEFFVAMERAKSISTQHAQNEIFLSPISKDLEAWQKKLKIVTGLKIDTRCQVKS